MGLPAAKEGDMIEGVSILIVLVPVPPPVEEVPTPLPFDYSGPLDGNLSRNVMIGGRPAAMIESTGTNIPPFEAQPRPGPFEVPPSDTGTILSGSLTVRINGRGAAREGDRAMIAFFPEEAPVGTVTVLAPAQVFIGE